MSNGSLNATSKLSRSLTCLHVKCMQNAISLKATTNSPRKSCTLVGDNFDRTACGKRLLNSFFKSTETLYELSIHWIVNRWDAPIIVQKQWQLQLINAILFGDNYFLFIKKVTNNFVALNSGKNKKYYIIFIFFF